ncbi:Immunoglobulin I-set domain protein [Sedimentisphaera cyanobacteriorum]|uniref:Immunoglobulin I-set domain protein n=1 Tax=Sedimentisphaera cyanobacteriorum TaxID=1940790 RepID=A0A1Q2HMS7_9BACT|nr:LamG-like jellyroll fold domain-containing protein [Sedimentisphaera cyanobacteriorum]AQQ08742.1 Immunoglobulin I-set domain protein [Sedimentisphaera cyanobacteriorum]
MKKLLLILFCCLVAASAWAGEIVPQFDDGDALVDYTAARDGVANPADIISLNPGSSITFAAKFTPSVADVTEDSGPVAVIETGGTTYGSGIWLCNGELHYAFRANVSGNNDRTFDDFAFADGAGAVKMGNVEAEQEVKAWVSLDLNSGTVLCSVNGVKRIYYLDTYPASTNLTGNQSVSFLTNGSIIGGHMGGLNLSSEPLLNDGNVWGMNPVPGTELRGQIFSIVADPDLMANDPVPASGSVNIDPDVISEVSFDTAEDPENSGSQNPDVTGHFVTFYQGANGDPNLDMAPLYETFVSAAADPITVPINTAGTFQIQLGQEVFWCVEEQISGAPEGDPANITGPLWNFETLPATPAAVSQPEDEAVFAGEQAVFEYTFTSKSAANAAWYKQGEPDVEMLESDPDVTISLAQNGDEFTSTLYIDNVEVADQGYYYCIASNDAGDTQSSSASLAVKRMVAYWPLDGDYQDYSGEGNHLTPYAEPIAEQWVDGVDPAKTGQALSTIEHRDTVAQTEPFAAAEYTDEVTMSMWLYWPGADSHPANNHLRTIFGSRDSNQNNWFWEFDQRTGRISVNAPGYNPYDYYNLPKSEWVYLAVTVSAEEVATFYVNGSEIDQTNPGRYSINTANVPVLLGTNQLDNLDFCTEAIYDDVRLYNYAMPPEDIAGLYYDVSGEQICVGPNAENLAYDVNGDCEVGIEDIAQLSVDWLNSMLYPSAGE